MSDMANEVSVNEGKIKIRINGFKKGMNDDLLRHRKKMILNALTTKMDVLKATLTERRNKEAIDYLKDQLPGIISETIKMGISEDKEKVALDIEGKLNEKVRRFIQNRSRNSVDPEWVEKMVRINRGVKTAILSILKDYPVIYLVHNTDTFNETRTPQKQVEFLIKPTSWTFFTRHFLGGARHVDPYVDNVKVKEVTPTTFGKIGQTEEIRKIWEEQMKVAGRELANAKGNVGVWGAKVNDLYHLELPGLAIEKVDHPLVIETVKLYIEEVKINGKKKNETAENGFKTDITFKKGSQIIKRTGGRTKWDELLKERMIKYVNEVEKDKKNEVKRIENDSELKPIIEKIRKEKAVKEKSSKIIGADKFGIREGEIRGVDLGFAGNRNTPAGNISGRRRHRWSEIDHC